MADPKKCVLIVEDERILAHALRDQIVREGFSVLLAKNGEEGLSTALSKHPDLILLDIIMPKMDGIGVLRVLRKDPWGRNARIMMLTNVDDSEQIAEVVSHGVYDFLIKTDWKLEDVVKKVCERLGVSREASPADNSQ